MIKVGLTGGIGSGKSTVSKILKDREIPIVDADIIAREVLNIYPDILTSIRKEFGEGYINEKGELKRRELGNLIFNNEVKRKKLEDITIPFIKEEIFKRMEQYNKQEEKICVVDAPTLMEHQLHKYMDINIVVWVDRKTQIERVTFRDKLSNDEAEARINSQMSLEEKRKLADFIIDNTKNLDNTIAQIETILTAILHKDS